MTSASMIDLFVPFSHFVIAREIIVRIAIRPGVPANNSPRFVSGVELACYQTCLGNWMFFHSFVGDDPLDADHLSLFVPFHGFPCDNATHFHPLESFPFPRSSLQSPSSDSYASQGTMRTTTHHLFLHPCKSRHLPQHPPCRPAIRFEIRARVPGCSSSFITISPCARFTVLPDETPGEIGVEVELDGITPDGALGFSGVVSVSSALGTGISPD